MSSLKHIHRLQRISGEKNRYRCVDPYCTYREHKKHLLGKASLCNSCGQEMILTKEDLRRSKPVCVNCSNTAEAKEFRKKQKLMQSITESMEKLELPNNG